MAVRTNTVSLQYAKEDTLGVLPGSPDWKTMEPNEISTYGATITTVARNPISPTRQNRKGAITDLDSAVEIPADLTIDAFNDFAEGFMFSTYSSVPRFDPSAVTASAYTVASGGALTQNTLVFARDFAVEGNNGLKVVDSGSTSTSIPIVGGLTVEASPPAASEVEVCGVRGASGDIEINSDGNIISTTLDFTTLGLTVGQGLFVGGAATANQFAVTGNSGLVRIVAVAANLITIDKTQQAFSVDDGSGKEIDLYFGPFLRNVDTDAANFNEQSYQFEVTYDGLDAPNSTEYEYAIGNLANTLAINMPLTDKATATFGFIGTDTEVPTPTRKTNAANAADPNKTAAMNTTNDFLRLRLQQVDETGLASCFKNLTLNISNNVSPEKCVGQLGAISMNFGNFDVSGEMQVQFTDSRVAAAVRNNTTLTMDFAIQNSDGAFYFDIPSITLGDGTKEFPVNETVLINITGNAFVDATLGYTMGITYFPYLPPKA